MTRVRTLLTRRRHRASLALLLAATAFLAMPELAHAQVPTAKAEQVINGLAAGMLALGAGILTICGVAFLSKLATGRAHWADGSNVMWAGVGLGSLVALVTFLLA